MNNKHLSAEKHLEKIRIKIKEMRSDLAELEKLVIYIKELNT